MTFFSFSTYLLLTILGILPSLIWLIFYLHKDAHPEPKKMILKVFILGIFMGPLAIIVQYALLRLGQGLNVSYSALFLINILLFAPLTEEYLKYAAVKHSVLKNPCFDEPLDAMLYLVISALGFAAIENLLNIFYIHDVSLRLAASQSLARFLSATLLHTLSSGLLGYFLARSLLNLKKKNIILTTGFVLAILFHGFYNYLAWLLRYNNYFTIAMASLLVLMLLIVGWQFKRLKKTLSVCEINC